MSLSSLKKTTLIISVLAFVKLIIQFIGNRNYGFHRDELLHLSASEHLSWGYMEFPPFIAFVGRVAYGLFNYSLLSVRLFPALAGAGILILCCLIAKELKGNRFSVFLAGICILSFLPFYRNHTLFQPVVFDQLFWTLGFYFLVRFLTSSNKNYLLLTGTTLGLGLLNKYTMAIWAFGVFTGFLFYDKGKLFKNTFVYTSGVIALLIALPNIIWQFQHGFPLLSHLQELNENQLSQIDKLDFGREQLNYPITFFISLLGVFFLAKNKTYRCLGISALVIFFTMWLLQAKSYYIFAIYPILFASGSVQIAKWLEYKNALFKYLIVLLLLGSSFPFIPHLSPILNIEKYTKYAKIEENAEGRYALTGDYADMFGWEEQAMLIDSIYSSLGIEDQKNTVIWAENYGEAGALKILGKKYNLPNPICRHGSFWTWGFGNKNADLWISLGNERPAVEYAFEETELVRIINHPFAIDEENGIPVYLCRKPKLDIEQWWKDFEPYIFD